MGTGSKCLGENELSLDGSLVHDSHAEVVAKRAFILYLLDHLEKVCNAAGNDESKEKLIFEYVDDSKTFRLKNAIKFHFYSSHPPCGDATIAHKSLCSKTSDRFAIDKPLHNKSKRPKLENSDNLEDIHRTGAKCVDQCLVKDPLQTLEGLKNYHVLGAVRKKPGRGDPTESLSCSDKMAKWNFVGLQGSLLSSLLPDGPIMWSSLVIGGAQLNVKSIDRSMFSRFDHLGIVTKRIPIIKTENTFQFSKTDIIGMESKDKELIPCSSNIAFSQSDGNMICHDIMVNGRRQGVTKKHLGTTRSRVSICRINISKKFVELLLKLHDRCSDNIACAVCTKLKDKVNYSDLKLVCYNKSLWYGMLSDKFYSILPGLKDARQHRRKRLDDFHVN